MIRRRRKEKSYITVDVKGRHTSYVGPDAIELYRRAALIRGMRFLAEHGFPVNTAWTQGNLLAAATVITKKKYKKSKKQLLQAADDIEALMPVLRRKVKVVREAD